MVVDQACCTDLLNLLGARFEQNNGILSLNLLHAVVFKNVKRKKNNAELHH